MYYTSYTVTILQPSQACPQLRPLTNEEPVVKAKSFPDSHRSRVKE